MRSFKGILVIVARPSRWSHRRSRRWAFVTGTSGQVIRLNPAPHSVVLNVLPERDFGVRVRRGPGQDARRSGRGRRGRTRGPTACSRQEPRRSPTGTVVDSHLIHSDPPAGTAKVLLKGTVTFPETILGVIGSTAGLAASDSALGALGTLYAGTTHWRGLEGKENGGSKVPDSVTISAGPSHHLLRGSDLRHGRVPRRDEAQGPAHDLDDRLTRPGDRGQRRAVHDDRHEQLAHSRPERPCRRHAPGRNDVRDRDRARWLLGRRPGQLHARDPRRRALRRSPSSC